MEEEAKRLNIRILRFLFILVGIVLIGTVSYHHLEGWSYFDSFYFSVITLTTVGFGDFHPTTHPSKLFTIFYVFFGVALMLYALTNLASYYFSSTANTMENRLEKTIGKLAPLKESLKIRKEDYLSKEEPDAFKKGSAVSGKRQSDKE